jgi:hypothetical protein
VRSWCSYGTKQLDVVALDVNIAGDEREALDRGLRD